MNEKLSEDQIKGKLVQIIREVLPEQNTSNIKHDVALRSQFRIDSLDFLDIVMAIRKEMGVLVKVENYSKLLSVKDAARHLSEELSR